MPVIFTSRRDTVTTVTADYVMAITDEVILVDTTLGTPITITLPAPIGSKGKRYSIKKIGADNTTVVTVQAAA